MKDFIQANYIALSGMLVGVFLLIIFIAVLTPASIDGDGDVGKIIPICDEKIALWQINSAEYAGYVRMTEQEEQQYCK